MREIHQLGKDTLVVSAQNEVGMLDNLVPITFVKIETCGKGMCGIEVETPLWHLVVALAQVGQSFFQVSLYLGVGVGHCSAVVFHKDIFFGRGHVRDTFVGAAQFIRLVSL